MGGWDGKESACNAGDLGSIPGLVASLEKGYYGLPLWLKGKESARNVGDLGSILGWEDPLEEGIATHSSILAWRIPWTEEPTGLQSMGWQRVGRGWATRHSTAYIQGS